MNADIGTELWLGFCTASCPYLPRQLGTMAWCCKRQSLTLYVHAMTRPQTLFLGVITPKHELQLYGR